MSAWKSNKNKTDSRKTKKCTYTGIRKIWFPHDDFNVIGESSSDIADIGSRSAVNVKAEEKMFLHKQE